MRCVVFRMFAPSYALRNPKIKGGWGYWCILVSGFWVSGAFYSSADGEECSPNPLVVDLRHPDRHICQASVFLSDVRDYLRPS